MHKNDMFCPNIIKLERKCIRGNISDKWGRMSLVLIDLDNCKISFKIHHSSSIWEKQELSFCLIPLFSNYLYTRWQILREHCSSAHNSPVVTVVYITNVWKPKNQLLERINEPSNVWKGLYTFPVPDSNTFFTVMQLMHWWLTGDHPGSNFWRPSVWIDDIYFMLHASQIWNGVLLLKAFSCFWLSDPRPLCDHAAHRGNRIHRGYTVWMPKPAPSLNILTLDIEEDTSLDS